MEWEQEKQWTEDGKQIGGGVEALSPEARGQRSLDQKGDAVEA